MMPDAVVAEPRRYSVAGPMAQKSMDTAKKTEQIAKLKKPIKATPSPREIVSVRTSTPRSEQRYFPSEALQVYHGLVNNLMIVDTGKDAMCCKYTEDMHKIAVGFTDGSIILYDCQSGARLHELIDAETLEEPGPVTGIKHRPVSSAHPVTESIICSYVKGSIKCWKYGYEHCLYTIREKRQTLGLCYHPRQSKFISYGDDARLNMYDEEAQTQERAFYSSQRKNVMDGHVSRIFACAFHTRSNHELISGGWDNTVMCWDDRQPYATRSFFDVHICGEGLDFDKAGKTILTCSWQEQNTIQLWDYGSCKLIETITPDTHQSKLYCGKFVPKANMVVCGGSDCNIIRVVDLNLKITECSIRNNPGGVYSFDFGSVRRKKKGLELFQTALDLNSVPKVAFVSGKQLHVIDFG